MKALISYESKYRTVEFDKAGQEMKFTDNGTEFSVVLTKLTAEPSPVKTGSAMYRISRADNGWSYESSCILARDTTTFIGAQIREFRKAKNMSQEQLGELAGMTKGTISRLENGRWSPSVGSLDPILKALDCNLEIQKK